MVQMAVSPLPQWFEGSEYTHKSRGLHHEIWSDFTHYVGADF